MKVLNKIIEYVLAFLVVVMVAGCFWQIFTRFILNDPSKWTEELLRYALIWLTMLGVPYAYGKEQHISIGFITGMFTKKGTVLDKIFIDMLILGLSVFVMVIGGTMVSANAVGQVSPAMNIPMQFYYMGVPVCGILMVIYAAERLIRLTREYAEIKKEGK